MAMDLGGSPRSPLHPRPWPTGPTWAYWIWPMGLAHQGAQANQGHVVSACASAKGLTPRIAADAGCRHLRAAAPARCVIGHCLRGLGAKRSRLLGDRGATRIDPQGAATASWRRLGPLKLKPP